MAIITMPASPGPSVIGRPRLIAPAQENVSPWTGARQVLSLGRGWFELDYTLPTIIGDAKFLPWGAFLARMSTRIDTARVKVVRRAQSSASQTARHAGGGQTGVSLSTDGWPSSTKVLLAGQFVTIEDQLLQLTDDVDSNGSGAATIEFRPPLRAAPANDAAIEYRLPTALVTLISDPPAIAHSPHEVYTIPTLQFREAF